MATPTKHAFLSASKAHRFIACTAAPHFEAQFPEGPPSPYAAEGTLAHSICELYARKHLVEPMSKRKFNSQLKKLQAKELYDPEMLKTAEAYIDFLSAKAMTYDAMPVVTLETRVDFSDIVPEGFGTCDCAMVGGDTLSIVDYKHGKGVPVAAKDNPQLRLYAWGALRLFRPFYGDNIQRVSMSIFQPRLSTELNEEALTVAELQDWAETIKPLALEAYTGPGKFVPGDHCRFCRGKAQCRARAENNLGLEEFRGCAPDKLSDAEIGQVLTRGAHLAQWLKDVEEYATQTLLDGGAIPGYKLIEGVSKRRFDDPDAAMTTARENGYDKALLYNYTPITLTALEKLMGKVEFDKVMAGHVIKPPGKPKLVPEDDPKPPYSPSPTAAEFDGVA